MFLYKFNDKQLFDITVNAVKSQIIKCLLRFSNKNFKIKLQLNEFYKNLIYQVNCYEIIIRNRIGSFEN